MLAEGLSRRQLQVLTINTLKAANTMAGQSVYEPRPWPTKISELPALLVQTPRERKVSLGRGVPQFTTTISLAIVGRLKSADAESANADIDTLSEQVEDALLSTAGFVANVQQFTVVDTQLTVTAEGEYYIGEFGIVLDCEVYQLYGPNEFDPLIQVHGTIADMTSGETLTEADVSFPPPP